MNELIIKKGWVSSIIAGVIIIVVLAWGCVYMPNYRYSFAFCPLIIGVIISIISDFRGRHEKIVFGKFGITLPDGTLCKWGNIRLIELKFSLVDRWCMYVHTNNHVFKENLEPYNIRPVNIAEYLKNNRSEIRLDFYARRVLGVILASEHPMKEYSCKLKKKK